MPVPISGQVARARDRPGISRWTGVISANRWGISQDYIAACRAPAGEGTDLSVKA